MGSLQTTLSDDQRQLYDCLSDRWWRLNNLYWVEDEKGNRVLFKLRPAQELLLRTLWHRNIILKARQIGFTTAIDILGLDTAVFNAFTAVGIIAHTLEDVKKIFRTKVRFPYENLPDDIRAHVKARSERENELLFTNGSSIRVAVSMRSGTLQFLHISEYGKLCAKFPKKAEEVKTGSLPTVHEGGIVIIESTAEGVGGDYHAKCIEAEAAQAAIAAGARHKLSWQEYKFFFFAWWQDDKYRAPVPPGFEFSRQHTEYFEETEAVIGRQLDPDQRYWYVLQERQLDSLTIKQEFPSYPSEAFLFSGRKAFDPRGLSLTQKQCLPAIWSGDIKYFVPAKEAKYDDSELVERPEGMLLIWAHPVEGMDYVIGADVAEGLEHGDYSSADVLDETGMQVAQVHGHLDVDVFGRVLNWLGRYYNKAFLGVERNNHGHAVLMRLKDLGYPRLFVEERIEGRQEEQTATEKVGWHTNQITKPFIIDNLAVLIRDGESGIRSALTVQECNNYVVDERGRYGAQKGANDDRVMSYAISHEMLRRKPRKKKPIKLIRRKRDWRGG